MNRVWIACLALGLTLPAVTGRAQFFSDDVIEKGTWFLGANLQLRTTEGGGQERFEAQVWPRGGYFFADNWAIVPQVFVESDSREDDVERFEEKGFITGISVRRYVALSRKLFFHCLVGYNFQLADFTTRNKQSDSESSAYFIRHQVNAALVIMYFVTPRLAIESQFASIALFNDGFAYDGRGSTVFLRANFLPQRAAENFSFLALSYYFGR